MNYFNLEESNNYNNVKFKLENDDLFLFEDSDEKLSGKNIISNIDIVPYGETNDKTNNIKKLTIFNPSASYDADTNEFEQ